MRHNPIWASNNLKAIRTNKNQRYQKDPKSIHPCPPLHFSANEGEDHHRPPAHPQPIPALSPQWRWWANIKNKLRIRDIRGSLSNFEWEHGVWGGKKHVKDARVTSLHYLSVHSLNYPQDQDGWSAPVGFRSQRLKPSKSAQTMDGPSTSTGQHNGRAATGWHRQTQPSTPLHFEWWL